MNIHQEQWITAVRHEVDGADMGEFSTDHKAALQRQLDYAGKLLNGTPDKLSILFESHAEKIVRDVRQELTLSREIKKHIKKHADTCKFRHRVGLVGLWDRLIDQYPVLTVVLLIYLVQSGYLPQLLKFLTK